jgi:WS/DGAT/MGAT family acyltransferase
MIRMDRLSALDAEFLHVEDDIAHMHIGGVCIFDGAAPTPGEFRALIAGKLDQIPRYRQRVRTVPFELGRPIWVDDPHFHLDYHVRHTALARPGTEDELNAMVGRVMSQPLDSGRPLWEAWVVEGLSDDRWALVLKVHHCMVDGVAGVGLLTVLLDVSSDAEVLEPAPWEPEPEPSGVEKILDAWGGAARDAVALFGRLPASLSDPLSALRSVSDFGQGLGQFMTSLWPTERSSIDGTIGPHRVWRHASVPFAEVTKIRRAHGGTVNDVVLCALSAGYRALLDHRGDDPDRLVVRTMIPVSVRGAEASDQADNRVSTLLYELPIEVIDSFERLERISRETAELKGSHMAEAGEFVTSIGNLAPPLVLGPLTRAAVRAVRSHPQQSVNTVTTNVPGPQFPLFCLGHEMLEYRPFVPISHGVRVGTAILSYNGNLCFGVTGDYTSADDVGVLADATVAEIHRMARRSKKGPRRG